MKILCYYQLEVFMDKGHIILNGCKKIMFSAPHAVEQTRDGKIKFAEKETAEIALKLNSLGYPCIIKTKNVNDDANFDLVSDYKNDLVEFIKENKIQGIIDLHQLSPLREQLICLGTGGEECLNLLGSHDKEKKLQEHFKTFFNNVSVNNPFAAKGDGTISRYISNKCHVPCVQVEINSKLFLENNVSIEEIVKILDKSTYILENIHNEKDLIS